MVKVKETTKGKAKKTKTPDLQKRSRVHRWGRRKGQPRPHPRLRQRAAEVRRRPWRLVALLALVAALVAGVIYLFGFSSAFVVEEVTVAGADGEIANGAYSLAAQNTDRPMARVDTQSLEAQILEDLRIDSVDVGRAWPSTIALDLTLREPALVVNQSGVQGLQLVDAEGVVYDTVSEAPEDVPIARAPKGDLDPADLRAVQAVPAALPAGLVEHAQGLRLRDGGSITFTVGAIEVIWGDGANAELKGRVLEGLLAQEGMDPGIDTDDATDPEATDGEEAGEDTGEDGAGVEAEPELVPNGEPIVIDVSTPSTPVVTGLQTVEPTS